MYKCHDKPLTEVETLPFFIGDGPHGEYWVECENCGQMQDCGKNCITCGKYFIYRSSWSW